MEEVGPARGEGLRLANAVERAEGIAHGQAHARPRDEHLDVAPHPARELVGQRGRVARPAEGEQRADLAQRGVGIVGRGRPGRPVALERLAVEPALGEDVAQEHGGGGVRRAARGGPAQLGRAPGRAIPSRCSRGRGRARRPATACGRGRRRVGRELGEELVQRRRIERELARELVAAHLGGQLGRDRDRRILVLEVDRERELLGDVERLELQRAAGLPERAVEVAELAQHEAQVVVRAGDARVGVHRAAERVARILEPPQLHEHQAHAVPRHGARRSAPRGRRWYSSSAAWS